MERNLFKYIWRYSKRQQFVILGITVLSFPILYISLELPKQIINEAIGGTSFPKNLLGFELEQVPFLLALCTMFLALVVVNNIIKYVLNVYRGLTGERMLRRLRYQLFERVLRFRLPHFGKISAGEIIPMITAEVQPFGGFIGDAIATPAFQGGTLLVYLFFIFVQDPLLGAAAVALYPVQGYIIPKLQKHVNRLGKERVRNLRQLSERVGESIAGIREIHAHDTSAFHMADVTDKLHRNFEIRYEIFRRKFGIKFLNNFLNQLTPFLFYSIGGYQVIQGNISFGALVAVLAAYKDLAGPWKELLGYYQILTDTIVKYEAVMEQFDPPDILSADYLDVGDEVDLSGAEEISIQNATFVGDGSGRNVESASATIPLKGRTAIVGNESSGRSQLLQLITGLLEPKSGRLRIGRESIDALPASVLGRYFAFVDTTPYIFTGTIRQNLVYGLQHRPIKPLDDDEIDDATIKQRLFEAKLTGARGYEIQSQWEDLEEAGVESLDALEQRVIDLVAEAGIGNDIYRMGLQSSVDSSQDPAFSARVLEARGAIRDRVLSEPKFGNYVHLWAQDRYNESASMIENILFGLPSDPSVKPGDLAAMPELSACIKKSGLEDELVSIGREIAKFMVELFANISEENDLLAEYSFIPQEDIPIYEALLNRLEKNDEPSQDDAAKLVALSFMLIPTRHRLGLISKELMAKVVAARPEISAHLDAKKSGFFTHFKDDSIVGVLSIEDNLLFGKPRLDRPNAREEIERFIGEIVSQQGLRDGIMRAGLSFHVGVSGSRLSTGQKMRVAIIRAALRRPDVIVVDGLVTGGGDVYKTLSFLGKMLPDTPVICGMSDVAKAEGFEHVIAMHNGSVIAEGRFEKVRMALQPQKIAAE